MATVAVDNDSRCATLIGAWSRSIFFSEVSIPRLVLVPSFGAMCGIGTNFPSPLFGTLHVKITHY